MSDTQKLDFSAINDTTEKSFIAQKNLIKRVLKGTPSQCPECQKPLTLRLPTQANKHSADTPAAGIFCAKGCTDIELDMEAVNKLK
ncbi:hypothetical protein [Shewanella sp. SR44-3]|uniref:hypothetical protein n=1 Tax=unclassified Shewanella TaxID=196818 RepID=UPI0015FD7200|nr:hypothetical protein [Shewanella sp. SR44-3]MBB1268183.1 hypothetical protein [Shewanella sp. SR44-3]